MPIELKMPALSPTMEKGNLAKWLVSVGDVVKPGDLLAEIETDKATMEFEAIDEGTIASIVVTAGTEDVAVGAVIALLSSPDEADVDNPQKQIAKIEEVGPPTPAAQQPAVMIVAEALPAPIVPPSSPQPVRRAPADPVKVSRLAQRIAEAKNIDLTDIVGSGRNGRIVRADLGLAPRVIVPSTILAATVVTSATIYSPPADVPHTVIKLTSMHKTIARRLTEAKQTVPHFYLSAHCNIDALLKLRGELNASLSARGLKLSVNDMLIKAMALAMTREPDANVQFAGDEMYRFDRVDIAMAVAIKGGLITPVIRDVAALSLSAIAEQSKQLAARTREGKLMPDEYQGGTASISNLGMFGIDEMFPVINPPQALILGIGSGIEKPWKVEGAIAFATIMTATASFDHRAIDGATAARFMSALRDLVEQPVQILC